MKEQLEALIEASRNLLSAREVGDDLIDAYNDLEEATDNAEDYLES